MRTWVRVLLISVLAIAVLAVVGVAAYRLGFQAGASQQFASEFEDRMPMRMWGSDEQGGWFGSREGMRGGFPMMGGFHPMRHWGFGFFHPGMFLGLIVLGLLAFLLVKAFSTPAPAAEKPTKARRK